MGATKAYLSQAESESLVNWLVAHGGTYPKYAIWCEDNKIATDVRFTPAYFRNWMQRKRALIQKTRASHRQAIRDASVMDRAARLTSLEHTLGRLERTIMSTEDLSPDSLVRLEEQKRKTLESIAKERGEFNRAPEEDPAAKPAASLGAGFAALYRAGS